VQTRAAAGGGGALVAFPRRGRRARGDDEEEEEGEGERAEGGGHGVPFRGGSSYQLASAAARKAGVLLYLSIDLADDDTSTLVSTPTEGWLVAYCLLNTID
jgi:hypothetical protein